MTVTTVPISAEPTLPITDIFIKTYSRDHEYLKYCLASIEKFCTGFRQVVIVDSEHPQGYLDQQVQKLSAHYRTDADFILFTDSDTLFTQPVTPDTFMVDGKPIWIHTPWTPELRAAVPWFEPMRKFAGEDTPSEFMRRQGFMVPRQALEALQLFCWAKHKCPLEDYIMGEKIFSEYNSLGAYCWKFMHDRFHWVDSSKDELPALVVHQAWSHTPLEENIPVFNRILGQP